MNMRKKYSKPKLTVEKMNLSLLVDVSNIHIGARGSFEAKGYSSCLTMKKMKNGAVLLSEAPCL